MCPPVRGFGPTPRLRRTSITLLPNSKTIDERQARTKKTALHQLTLAGITLQAPKARICIVSRGNCPDAGAVSSAKIDILQSFCAEIATPGHRCCTLLRTSQLRKSVRG